MKRKIGISNESLNNFLKIISGEFCGFTGNLNFGLWLTLPMGFKARVDAVLPALTSHLCIVINSDSQTREWTGNLSYTEHECYDCATPASIRIRTIKKSWFIFIYKSIMNYLVTKLIIFCLETTLNQRIIPKGKGLSSSAHYSCKSQCNA